MCGGTYKPWKEQPQENMEEFAEHLHRQNMKYCRFFLYAFLIWILFLPVVVISALVFGN